MRREYKIFIVVVLFRVQIECEKKKSYLCGFKRRDAEMHEKKKTNNE